MQPDYSPYSINPKVQFPLNQDNPDIRKKMGKLNRLEVIRKYSWEETAKKVLSLYEKVKKNSDNNRKALFLIPNLSGGGAERVMSNLLNYLSDKLKIIPVFFNDDHVYSLPKNCKVYYLDHGLPKIRFIKKLMRIIHLRRIIKKETPDVALSFLANIYLIISIIFPRKLNVKLVIAERNTMSYILKSSKYGAIKEIIAKLLYRKADNILAVSKGVSEDLVKTLKLPKEKNRVIYNPYDVKNIKELAKEEPIHPWLINNKEYPVIINVARLTYQKGHDILLKAIKIVSEKIESRLIILGEGPLLSQLKNLSKELGIEDKVDFAGFQENPFAFISRSDVFVLSSRWEGFPNVLIEAMACGIPVISTDCHSGPNEIIEHGVNGILVPIDIEKLAESIIWVLTDIEFAERIARRGRESVEKYNNIEIFEHYLKVLQE